MSAIDRLGGVAMIAALACGFLAWCAPAFALNPALDVSQYGHTSWKVRDGFFKSRITVVAQTPDGYLWLGTELGLLRFDGVRSISLQLPKGQSLPHSWIRSLHVGRDGTLWIGTLGGLASWKDNTLRRYPEVTFNVDTLVEDRGGTLWAGGSERAVAGRLCAIRDGTVRCHGDDGALGRIVSALYEDDHGALWVLSDSALWQWTPGSPKSYSLPDPVAGGLQALTRGESGAPLLATTSGIIQLADAKFKSLPISIRFHGVPSNVFRDRDGGLWIGTTSGGLAHVHNGRTDVFTRSDGLSGDFINRFFEDREGNIWVATLDGLDRFRELPASTFSVNQGLSSATAHAVLATEDGSVWINSSGVLNRWKDGRITIIRKPDTPGTGVQSLFRDSRGRIWVTTPRGVGHLEGDQLASMRSVSGGFVTSITEDTRAVLWIANQDLGLLRLSSDKEVQHIPWTRLGHTDPGTQLVADPSRGGLWVGFFGGGLVHYADNKVTETYSAANGLGNGRVAGLRLERDGALWAATESGLSRLKSGRIATLTTRNGLPCDGMQWMMDDEIDSVWLRMNCGLVRIARSELAAWATTVDQEKNALRTIPFTLFDNSDGIRSGFFASTFGPAVARSADGRLWFVDYDGVTVVDPRHTSINTVPPPVHIEEVTADREIYELSSTAGNHLRLPPLIRDLRIDYTALSLVAPEKTQFRYKLEGRDRDWQSAGNRRQAFYNDLAPGSYRFRVIAANNSGVWNETGATLDFTIAPAYYQTTWFPALVIGFVIAGVWAAHRIRLRIVEKHQREILALNERLMKAQEQERIRIAGELHDGVMQQMLAVTMMLGTAKRRTSESETKTSLDKIQEKLIQAGTDIRQLSHDLHPPVLQEAGLPEAMRNYCEQFSASSGIVVACDADDRVRDLSRGAALALFRIVQEALGNAAKHAHAKRIAVRLSRSADEVSLTVSDDGAGFDPGQLGTKGGLGLVMMRERASQLNGTFGFDSAPGRGTTIRVTIPFR
jgi:signal transduction histidine kinase/ligand-binding sensor domain-containing protein